MAKSSKPAAKPAAEPAAEAAPAARPAKPADAKLFLVQVPAAPGSKRKFTYKIVREVGEIPAPGTQNEAEAKLFLDLLDGYFNSPAMRPLLMLSGKFPAGFDALRDMATRFRTLDDED
jgi:hypothetical protein